MKIVNSIKDLKAYLAEAKQDNKKIGFVFQNFLLNDYLTVIENVCLPLITNKKLSKQNKWAPTR